MTSTYKPATRESFVATMRKFVLNNGRGTPDGYGRPDYSPSRGEVVMIDALADYIASHASEKETGVNWLTYLDHYVCDGLIAMRTRPDYEGAQRKYTSARDDRDSHFPHPTDVHVGGLDRLLSVHHLIRLLPLLADVATNSPENNHGWLGTKLELLFHHQQTAIDQAWHSFVRLAYAPLIARIKDETHRGNKGTFGSTKLMSWAGMGRVMFTFTRGDGDVTYVADDGDPIGIRSGANTTSTPYQECVAMINDVTSHWDMAKFKPDKKVSFCGMYAWIMKTLHRIRSSGVTVTIPKNINYKDSV